MSGELDAPPTAAPTDAAVDGMPASGGEGVKMVLGGTLVDVPAEVESAAALQGWKQAALEQRLHDDTRRSLAAMTQEASALAAEIAQRDNAETRAEQAELELKRVASALADADARAAQVEARQATLLARSDVLEAQVRTLVAGVGAARESRSLSQRLAWLRPSADSLDSAAGTLLGSRTWRLACAIKRLARPWSPGDMAGAAQTLLERAGLLKESVGSADTLADVEAAAGSLLEIITFLRNLRAYRAASAVSGLADSLRLRTATPAVLEYLHNQTFEFVGRLKVIQSLDEATASGHLAAQIHALYLPVSDAPEVSIIIPVHNQYRFTFSCLLAVLLNSEGVTYEVIVVDDKSSDETEAMLSRMHGVRVIRNTVNEGFVLSCRRGAEAARGQILIFLNNDTLPLPGWLSAMTKTFVDHPEAGLVGAKLLNPDGSLQEAGGIIWGDGSAWNYGRGLDASMPEYNYLREADFCSGACIGVPRNLYFDVGGFDRRYVPAYFEDTDLAVTIAQAGRKVLYQPRCEVIHFDGATQRVTGTKRYFDRNAELFASKWTGVFSGRRDRGVDPDLEKDRGKRGRVLVVDHYVPRPDQDAGSMRMAEILRVLSGLGLKVTFAPENLHHDLPYTQYLQDLGVETVYAPQVTSLTRYIRDTAHTFDVVILSRFDIAPKYIDLLREVAPGTRVVFDTVDLASLRTERLAELMGAAADRTLAANLRQQEVAMARKADVTLVVSDVERSLLEELDPTLDVRIVSLIHEARVDNPPFEERKDILFIGGFDHPPNGDAVRYFVQDILPRVSARLPGLRFYVIGSRPPTSVTSLASEEVIILGHVPDVTPYFDACRLSVAPLRYGAGVKGKINHSLSLGVPVVATPVAVEGMHLVDGTDVVVAGDAQAFADAVVRVYMDPTLWGSLSRNGLKTIESHFSAQVAREAVESLLADLVH